MSSNGNTEDNSAEDPPSYEESISDGWDANLTWPNALANREELAQIFRLNNFDYSTRSRAFTVSGPHEMQTPRYRNIINYFENSLEDMGSIEWSSSSAGIHRSARQLQQGSRSRFTTDSIDEVNGPPLTNRTGPRPHSIGAHSSSRDVIHWEYINEINPTTATRFTVRLVPETDEQPPNYTVKETTTASTEGVATQEERPQSTKGTCNIDTMDHRRHCGCNLPAQLPQPPSAPVFISELKQKLQGDEIPLNRIETAPARLEKTDCEGPEGGEDHVKTVSFFLGDEPERKVKPEDIQIYPHLEYEKKEARNSETGDSGYAEEGIIFNEITPLKLSGISTSENSAPRDHIVQLGRDSSRSKLMEEHNEKVREWENQKRLLRYEEREPVKVPCGYIAAIVFFICDLIMIVTGVLLLVINYHDNVIRGFVLLGLGVGMLIPALNYIGGFPTVCAGIES